MSRLLIASLLLFSLYVVADSYKDLSAEYYIGGATMLDSPESEPPDTHIYFRIEGDAARDIYKIMASKPIRNSCIDDGTLTKWAKNIQCDFNPMNSTYTCYFSVDVNSNAIGLGAVC